MHVKFRIVSVNLDMNIISKLPIGGKLAEAPSVCFCPAGTAGFGSPITKTILGGHAPTKEWRVDTQRFHNHRPSATTGGLMAGGRARREPDSPRAS